MKLHVRDVLAWPGAEKLTGNHVHEVIQTQMGIKFDQTNKKNMYAFFQKCLFQSLAKKMLLTKPTQLSRARARRS